jgi:atypical dual specificity phosphatase
MTAITPNLYLGGALEATDHTWLNKNAITTVINVARELANVEYPPHMTVLKLTLDDVESENIEEHLDNIADFIHHRINSHKDKIFIHCFAGISRSATFVIYYIMKYNNMEFKTAFASVKDRRPQVNPNLRFMRELIRANNTPFRGRNGSA